MAYILDTNKNTTNKNAVPIGADSVVHVYTEFEVQPDTATEPYISIQENGEINIGGPSAGNNIFMNGGIDFNFKQLTLTGTNYVLLNSDYAVEVISNTYNSVTLPTSIGNAGRTYIVSRGKLNTNGTLVLKAQVGEDIDGRNEAGFWRAGTHIKVMSNGEGQWYII